MAAMILTWTVGWGLGFGGLIEAFVDPAGEIMDIWFTGMAIPGFLGGVMISALLLTTEGRRSFDEVSLPRFATWGLVTGVTLGTLAVVTGATRALPLADAATIGIATALGAVAAVGSALFFRLVSSRMATARPRGGDA